MCSEKYPIRAYWALATFLLGGFVTAQRLTIRTGGSFWVQYAGIGGLSPLVEGLRDQNLNYQAPSGLFGFGGGGGFFIGRLHIGGEGCSLYGSKSSGGAGWGRLGFVLPIKGSFSLMPVGFVGGGGLSFDIRQVSGSLPFSQVASANISFGRLSNAGLLAGGGIEVQKAISGGGFIGLAIGYLHGPNWADWTIENGPPISGGPRLNLGLPYIRLQIGGGGWAPSSNE